MSCSSVCGMWQGSRTPIAQGFVGLFSSPARSCSIQRLCAAKVRCVVVLQLVLCVATLCDSSVPVSSLGSPSELSLRRRLDDSLLHQAQDSRWWTRPSVVASNVWHVNQTDCIIMLRISRDVDALEVDDSARCASETNLTVDECIRICTSSCHGWVPGLPGQWINVRESSGLMARRADCPPIPPPFFAVLLLLVFCCIFRSCRRCFLIDDKATGAAVAAAPPYKKTMAQLTIRNSGSLEMDHLVPFMGRKSKTTGSFVTCSERWTLH